MNSFPISMNKKEICNEISNEIRLSNWLDVIPMKEYSYIFKQTAITAQYKLRSG